MFPHVSRQLRALIYHPKITDSVQANGSYIFLQVYALGHAADPAVLKREGGFDLVAPSPIPIHLAHPEAGDGGLVVPHELTIAELKEYVELYSRAAKNAIEAGFDGVEIHQPMATSSTSFCRRCQMNGRTNMTGL